MPFRDARPLSSSERRRVASIWAVAGALFACLWASALTLVLPGFGGVTAIAAIAVLSALGGLFFGLVAVAVVGIFSRSFARSGLAEQARSSDEAGLARNRQPLPLDTE
jgi:membrane protein implicated in regulation of membrane protease activity